MNIGFVSTWFERGAAYVTKAYIELLKDENNIYIYARAGEKYGKGDPNWDWENVTWGLQLEGTRINFNHFKKWIKKNNIEVIFFNEQKDVEILIEIKKKLPTIKIGAYIDYYKEDTIKEFWLYDFLICNTKRHYSVFKIHPQCYYVPWGTNIELFKPKIMENKRITFFHSMGMSLRKGTDILIKAFIEGDLYKESDLIIHTQLNLLKSLGYNKNELAKYNIKIIEKTVTAPGLYHLGDVYVYPTTLDGLGLTIYEALSVGLPVITTNNGPMNEIIEDRKNGYLVEVEKYCSRSDGYYWPLSYCDKNSLIEAMRYFIKNKDKMNEFKINSREYAISKLNWNKNKYIINEIFKNTKTLSNLERNLKKNIQDRYLRIILSIFPDRVVHFIHIICKNKKW
ncbi:glycosyltransferase family 4 protein [Fusobacterium mortiferum]|uniref:glycosyltransferase family 4 protein n=1 Tax=Fusobacterium mortiferum TaxID=850 RepID=UPI001F3E36F0|nr:glycosyltransferase family 4 protein [Fusobacterium mortiferum]MCF2699463.1 glycosyltransferase family 4 protein [Fusobacterium mortiferum]MCI7666873.1 glycosyltransferase family 4 protein [Fusobacterium mortiferum]